MQQQIGGPTSIDVIAAGFGLSPNVFLVIFLVILIWSLVIKGYALWHAAREGQKAWFIALLIANTFGILELAYLLFFRPKDTEEE